ncbi:DUF488 domain-containing protein [Leucobacter sp. USHLN153]|uniref:DUF488 domain-containing protein n=1 Tax=Leucobacter sp. USHLN153 TaxID=3081268 RepID=UPI003015DB58
MSGVLTIGHSTHSIEEFIALLKGAGATGVIDIRKLPGSRKFPHFDADPLAASLESAGLQYAREERLAGLRGSSPDVPRETNGNWRNQSFHRYADYALSAEFRAGLDRVIAEAEGSATPALMCAEAVWWRCHRRLVADHLIAREIEVAHVMPNGRISPASLTPGGVIGDDGVVRYPEQ